MQHSVENKRFYINKKEGECQVSFDGTPFSVEEEKILDCQYGSHYYQQKEITKKRQRFQGSRKVGCQAKIKIKRINLYTGFKITSEQKRGRTWRELQDLQKLCINNLRLALKQDPSAVEVQTKYWVSLPSEEAHSGHPVGKNALYSQRIHPLLVEKITEMVLAGITNTAEVKRSLKFYTTSVLTASTGLSISMMNRAFNPTSIDIRNHIHAAKKRLEISKLDQENVRLKVEQQKESNPHTLYFFRPFTKKEDKSTNDVKSTQENVAGCQGTTTTKTEATKLEVESDKNSSREEIPNPSNMSYQDTASNTAQCSGSYNGNTGDEDIVNIVGTSSQCSSTLLLVHQEQWQRELLAKYGNDISLIDATYKTTRYDIALFFVCVKTNVGYCVVGEFVIQDETAEQIEEALEILKRWNPHWQPKYFMTDYSEAELLAIEKCFNSTKVFLCDFHREQAWERWIKDHKHGLSKQEQDELLSLLRACANAPPSSSHREGQSNSDIYYKSALANLKSSKVWKDHKDVQVWLSTYWLSIPMVSALLYRPNIIICKLNYY